jgi:cytochrome c oxidase cbb3-type subunit I/II
MYWMRLVGGTLYLVGFGMMAWNLIVTARSGQPVNGEVDVVVESEAPSPSTLQVVFGSPVLISVAILAMLGSIALMGAAGSTLMIGLATMVAVTVVVMYRDSRDPTKATWHHLVEGKAMAFTVLTIGAVLIGGIAEIVPIVIAGNDKLAAHGQTPYTALELEGRDVFLKEGCYNCHSQMVRPFIWETARFGAASQAQDTIYDHPFQWGSKRTGPDLARLGGRYSDVWHYKHMLDPRELTPGSNMPSYKHLADTRIDFANTADKLRAMRNVGVPYTPEEIARASQSADHAARIIATGLAHDAHVQVATNSELVALIGYLQRLGHPVSPSPMLPASEGAVARVGGQ